MGEENGVLKPMVVVLEGTGGVGKSTQSRAVTDWMRNTGRNVCLVKLPCYKTPVGVLIEEMLSGHIRKWDPYTTQLYYALNRKEIGEYIERGLVSGWSFVIDRWVSSNALSTLGTLGLEWEEVMRIAKREPERFEEMLKDNFAWVRTVDGPYVDMFKGIDLVKIFLDVEHAQIAENSRVGRVDGVVNDVFEGGTVGELRMEILRRYIRWEGDWRRVLRTPTTGVEDITRSCIKAIESIAGPQNAETIGQGDFVDLGSVMENRIYGRENLEAWRSLARSSETHREDLAYSEAWSLTAPGARANRNGEGHFIYSIARRH